jgi:predicted ATPase
MYVTSSNKAEFREALSLAERFSSVAQNSADPNDRLIGDRLIAQVLYFLGEQSRARLHAERMLAGYVRPVHRSQVVRFQFDQQVAARITLAQVLWLQGFADQALRRLETNIEDAISINHPFTLCNALTQAACPIALLAGDLAGAERYTAMLLEHAARESVDLWLSYAGCYEGQLLIARGDFAAGLPRLSAGVDQLLRARFVRYLTAFMGVLAEALAASGDSLRASATVDEALDRCERTEERWCTPELMRIKGLLLLRGSGGSTAAADWFLDSIEVARSQGALAWELRTAISLAHLRQDQGRVGEAYDLLRSVHGRFSEGYGTRDLKAAKSLLDELSLLQR